MTDAKPPHRTKQTPFNIRDLDVQIALLRQAIIDKDTDAIRGYLEDFTFYLYMHDLLEEE